MTICFGVMSTPTVQNKCRTDNNIKFLLSVPMKSINYLEIQAGHLGRGSNNRLMSKIFS